MHAISFRRWVVWIGVGGVFLAGVFMGMQIPHWHADTSLIEKREQNSSFTFISPLLACESESSAASQGALLDLQKKLHSLIDEQKRSGAITEAGVYFRELKYGGWIGVNENLLFTPGSLLKVPLIMSVYEHAIEHPEITQNQYELATSAPSFPLHYPPPAPIQRGNAYTLDELVRATLIFSDNDAALMLSQVIDEASLKDSYERLGISSPRMGADYQVSVKSYASFFRILYNATYISRTMSEYVLSLLSESTFDKGLVAGLPAEIPVAHKFGERELGDGTVQLHDCGVVYTKPNPYILCVMTRGKDFTQLEKTIAEISRTTYSEIEAQKQ